MRCLLVTTLSRAKRLLTVAAERLGTTSTIADTFLQPCRALQRHSPRRRENTHITPLRISYIITEIPFGVQAHRDTPSLEINRQANASA